MDWTIFTDPDNFDEDFQKLLEKLKAELEAQDTDGNIAMLHVEIYCGYVHALIESISTLRNGQT